MRTGEAYHQTLIKLEQRWARAGSGGSTPPCRETEYIRPGRPKEGGITWAQRP